MKDAERDALQIVNLLCRVLESKVSMFRFYDLIDAIFIRKRDTTKENLDS